MAERIVKKNLKSIITKKDEKLKELNSKLKEAERLADLGKMSSAVAHELRNPLGVIRLATYSLRKKIGNKNQDLIKHLNNIDKKVTESDRIIHNLLSFSKVEEIKFVPNNLNISVELALKTVESNIDKSGIKIIKKLDSNIPFIIADFDQLVEIFSNLFLNAVQSMEASPKKELTISTSYKDNHVTIEINDTGVGIPTENIKKLGEPFFSTKVKGVGLGLYLVYKIIKKHNGSVSVKSKINKGSTFIIKLPKTQI